MSAPDPALVAGAFDRAAPTYDRAGVEFFAPFGERLVELAGIRAGERVLDVACGIGASLVPAARRVGAGGEAVGVDLAPGMVAQASAALAAERLDGHARAIEGDAQSPPFPDESFDAVLCGFGIFFLPDPDHALAEWRRVLRPGGRLAVSTWGAGRDERWTWERELPRELGLAPPPAVGRTMHAIGERFSSREALETALPAAGFEPPAIETMTIEPAFAGEDAYWAWAWSHGHRLMLEALTDEETERLRAAASQRLAAMRGPAGIPRRFSAFLAVARKPG